MMYVGRDLPPWVRFRDRPKPLPVYTVPTRSEWMLQNIERMTLHAMTPRIAESITRHNAFLGMLGRRGG
jgi:hypothetical protein